MEQACGGSNGCAFLRVHRDVALDAPRKAERGHRRSKDGIYSPARGGRDEKLARTGGGAGGCGHVGVGDGSRDGCFSAIGILRMNLNERIAVVTQFDPDGAIRCGDGFFLATKGSTFHPFEAKTKGRGFSEDYSGQFFSIRWLGEDREKMPGAAFFH